MVRNEAKYQEAVALRKRGFTYTEIAALCGISKATASNWLAVLPFSERIKEANQLQAGKENKKRIALLQKARINERKRRNKEVLQTARVEFQHYKHHPAFIAGLMAYICCGDYKDGRAIRLSSADHFIQRNFIVFTQNYLGVSRETIKVWLLLNKSHDEERSMRNWVRHAKLPYACFYKNQISKITPKKPTLHDGVLNTIIGSTVLKLKLMIWIELLKKDHTIK